MVTKPKTKIWDKPISELDPLHKGLLIGVVAGIILFLIFFLFILPHTGTTELSVSESSEVPVSNSINESASPLNILFGQTNDWTVWIVLLIIGTNILISITMTRSAGFIVTIITSFMIILWFHNLPFWLLFIVISAPMIMYWFGRIRLDMF